MGPGPSDVPTAVLEALSRQTIGHLDPEFVQLMEAIKSLLQTVFQTQNPLTLPLSAPGSAGMEFCLVNLLEAGDKVIICQNGVFGGRMLEIADRIGARSVAIQDEWGQPVDLNKVAEAVREHPDAKLIAFVHAETSTGARSDAESISKLAHDHGMLVLADTVTSLGGIPVEVDAWQLDAVYAGSQKCLSCVPGLSPVTLSERAIEQINKRRTKVQSWFLDVKLLLGYWGSDSRRSYHHTAPVNSLAALHASLTLLVSEGLPAAFARHMLHHRALAAGLQKLGIEFLVSESDRLPMLNSVLVPDGLNEAAVRRQLLDHYGIEIGAGLGALAGKTWRIGLMGHSARSANVYSLITALESILIQSGCGRQIETGAALTQVQQIYESST